MKELIALLFLAREIAHREHLKTRSFAAHMALNEFYTGIIENADAIAEAYQGQRVGHRTRVGQLGRGR